jgi:hypothetical protein
MPGVYPPPCVGPEARAALEIIMSETIHIVATKEQLRDLLMELLSEEREEEPPVNCVAAAEMCRRLSISRSTLHRMRHDGMPCLRVGTEYRYEPEVCLQWLRERSK